MIDIAAAATVDDSCYDETVTVTAPGCGFDPLSVDEAELYILNEDEQKKRFGNEMQV